MLLREPGYFNVIRRSALRGGVGLGLRKPSFEGALLMNVLAPSSCPQSKASVFIL